MRYILIILVFLSVGAKAQMIIKAHANYRPLVVAANPLLDDYPNAAAAYSLRKLRTAYTGAAIRVRKDTTGQPEQDIGFTASGDLDTNAIKNFCLTRDGYITTWYDQSGNTGRNASNATAGTQPWIYLPASGGIQRRNNKPAIRWQVNPRRLNAFKFAAPSTNFYYSMVASVDGTADKYVLGADGNGFGTSGIWVQPKDLIVTRSGAAVAATTSGTLTANTLFLTSSQYLSNNTAITAINGVQGSSTNMLMSGNAFTTGSFSEFRLGQYWTGGNADATFSLLGNISEFVVWQSNQSSNRTGIENNINTHYGIY